MGFIYRHFDGVPMIGIPMGDRFGSSELEDETRDGGRFGHELDHDGCDLVTLMARLEAGVGGREPKYFDAGPDLGEFERLLYETAKECAREEELTVRGLAKRDVRDDAVVSKFYGRLRRHWLVATIVEGLDIPCPSRRVFAQAVVAELRAHSRQPDRG